MYDATGAWEQAHRDFAWEYLGSTGSEAVTRRNIMNSDHWDHCTTPVKLDFAVQVLLHYRLLDILTTVLDLPIHPDRRNARQVYHPRLPNRIEQVSREIIFRSLSEKSRLVASLHLQLAFPRRQIRKDHPKRSKPTDRTSICATFRVLDNFSTITSSPHRPHQSPECHLAHPGHQLSQGNGQHSAPRFCFVLVQHGESL